MKFFMLAAVITGSQVQAQTDSSKTLHAVILTANKIEQKQAETGKVLTVISQQQLQKAGGKSISELLNEQVGINIGGANGALGTNQTVYVRGAVAANTLILLDGIPLYDASGISSEFDLNSFALDQVDRIEILKGAQSTLYGSDAVAGVINIITKKSTDKKLKLHANLSAGTYNTYKAAGSISGSNKTGFNYYAGYSKIYSDGFSAAYDSSGTNNFDKDGFKQDAVNLSVGFNATKKLTARIYGKYNINKAEIDAGAFTNDNDDRYETKNANAGTALKYQLKNADLHFNYNYNWYDRVYTNDSGDVGGFNFYEKGRYNGNNHFAELYANIVMDKHFNIVGGIDYRNSATTQSYFSTSFFGPFESKPLDKDSTHSKQFAAYASVLYNNAKGFNASVGGRWNHHSVYGNNATFSINPSYQLKHVKLFANIASAYRVPTLYQLYSEYGNASLDPEKTMSYEGGLQYNNKFFTARAVVFKRDIRDVLIFYSDPVTYESRYINEDKQKDYGVELETSATVKEKINIAVNYTYVDGKIFTKNLSGKDSSFFNLYRIPKNTFNLTISYSFLKAAFISMHLRAAGSRFEPKYAAAPVKLGNYYTLDMYAEYEFVKKIKLFADFHNITDQLYFDQEGFNTRRFNMNAGVIVNL
ncbi:TonB-dependent vitamin B12 receptor BtuB [soil metagenome]